MSNIPSSFPNGGDTHIMNALASLLDRAVPWNSRALWPIVLIEGVIATLVGLLVVIHPADTRDLVIRFVGVALVIGALIGLVSDWRVLRDHRPARYSIIRHGVMGVVGVVAAADPAITSVIAWGCILIGFAGMVLILAVPDLQEARWGIMVASAVTIIFGVLLFWALATGTFVIAIAGLGLVLAGCLLVVYSIRIARGMTDTRVGARA
jgi:uncharacterized membrane protein HdeD (DUF308 family)